MQEQRFPVESDAVRLVLGFLNERQRLRFLATSKALAPWRQKRRDAASDALTQLQAQGALWFRTKKMHPDGNATLFHNYSIQRCRDDAGLLLLRTSWHSTMSDGTTHHHDFMYRHFSPWAFAFVCIDKQKKEADLRIDHDDDVFATLSAVSARAF
jgi:hypothetical protein